MTQTFTLKKGEILFEEDKIIISDKAKIHRYLTLISSGLWILIALKKGFKLEQSNDESLYSIFIIPGILNLLLFVVTLFRSTKSIILSNDIKSLKVKKRFSNYYLDIRLKNNRLRRVIEIEETEEFEEYIEKYYSGLIIN